MNSLAKLKRKWHKELKQYLLGDLAISWCESCGSTYNLTIMHSMKQRRILTRSDYFKAAIICQPEHQSYDEATGDNVHERMREFVEGIIEKRNGS